MGCLDFKRRRIEEEYIRYVVSVYSKMINFNSPESNEIWQSYLHEQDRQEQGSLFPSLIALTSTKRLEITIARLR